jgi:hypothetical protein
MLRRLCMWAVIGFVVAISWVMVNTVMGPNYNLVRWTLVEVTAPAWGIGRSLDLNYYVMALLNGCAYAVVGLVLEPFLEGAREGRF